MQVGLSAGPGAKVNQHKITELFVFDAMGKKAVEEASAGDIVTFAGISDFNIGDTVVDIDDPRPLEPIAVEVPTMSITLGINKSPFAGRSAAKFLTSRQIRDRLDKELLTNVALKIEETGDADSVQVFGRGLLHLTVLMENMRREGYEIMVGPPKVIEKEIDGVRNEPWELVDVEVPEESSGAVVSLLAERKGNMIEMSSPTAEGMQTIQYELPTRGLVGVKSKILSATRGLAVMTTTFAGYKPFAGEIGSRISGNILSFETGEATAYALMNMQDRGIFYIKPGQEVFENQIIGVNAKPDHLKVNVCKAKKLTNMRSAGADEKANLAPPKDLSLEDAVEYVTEGEYVEITPDAVRMGCAKLPAKVGR
jgi:GTP-binding protein